MDFGSQTRYNKINMATNLHPVKKLLLMGLSILFVFLPLAGLAQTTSDAQKLPPAMLRSLQNATTTVEHPPVTVDVGIKRRFNDSPEALAEHELKAANVINKTRLQVFARHVAMTEPIERMDIGDEEITIVMNGPAKLFGFITTSVTYETTATFSDGIDDVSTTIKSGWLRHLTTERQPKAISEQVTQTVNQADYLSVTQLRAVIVEAIVKAVNNQ
jgi:hypothetical protein